MGMTVATTFGLFSSSLDRQWIRVSSISKTIVFFSRGKRLICEAVESLTQFSIYLWKHDFTFFNNILIYIVSYETEFCLAEVAPEMVDSEDFRIC